MLNCDSNELIFLLQASAMSPQADGVLENRQQFKRFRGEPIRFGKRVPREPIRSVESPTHEERSRDPSSEALAFQVRQANIFVPALLRLLNRHHYHILVLRHTHTSSALSAVFDNVVPLLEFPTSRRYFALLHYHSVKQHCERVFMFLNS